MKAAHHSLLQWLCGLWVLLLPCSSLSSAATSSSSSGASTSTSSLQHTMWADIAPGPPDAILGIAQAYRECHDARKVNVCVGAYRDEHGAPWVLPSVRQAAKHVLATENKEYLPIEGDVDFVKLALRFAYGDGMDLDRVAGVQALSGTGACRVGGRFLAEFLPGRTVYIPTPTWGNHWKIFAACGLATAPYRYYDRRVNALDLPGMLEDLDQAPDGSIILLHACAHNPTGCDPSLEQWKTICDVCERKQHVLFLDSAYQGFASGDAEADAAALRYCVRRKLPVLLAQSFAKNFGLYGERCGTLSVVCGDAAQADNVRSQLRNVIRPMYSSPPRHGSSIVRTVLADDALRSQYYQECAIMAARVQHMRTRLVEQLAAVGSQHDWSHITSQIGMFAFSGMHADMCTQLTDDYAIFLTKDGRLSLAGLNENNIDYVATAMHKVTQGKSITES